MQTKKRKSPSLRFRGYTDDWEERKLGELASFSKGNGYTKNDLVEFGDPIILYGRLYTKYETVIEKVDTFVNKKDNSIISEGSEVIVPASGESSEDISRASVVGKSGLILGGDLNIIKPVNYIDSIFLALTISNGSQRQEMSKRAQGKSVVHLHNSDLKQVNLLYPKLEEQQKIGTFFKQLDCAIALHQRKLDLLKEQKKGFLQKMFPKNGSKVPELRFEGFSDDWEERKLGELVEQIIREVPKPNKPYYRMSVRSHAKGTFKQFVDNPENVAMDKLFVVKKDDLVVNITFAWEHAIAVVNEENDGLLVSHRFPTYRADGKSDTEFLHHVVSKENFRRKLEFISPGGAGRNRVLNKKDFLKLKIFVPKIEEQQKIGSFFKQLDNTIALHQRKLDLLKEQKKGFLQKMFV
ncbi:MAG: restriction endonuclease subunit S [Enterococcus faecalis]